MESRERLLDLEAASVTKRIRASEEFNSQGPIVLVGTDPAGLVRTHARVS